MSNFVWSDLAITHGHGMAFWFEPETGMLHWGDTHYLLFHDLYGGNNDTIDRMRNRESGIFGWVFPDYYGDNRQNPGYYIDFGTDFGIGSNTANTHLIDEATQAIEEEIGYPAIDITGIPKQAGHDVEPDDQNWQLADSTYDFPNREAPSDVCTNCGSLYTGDFCQDCGDGNMNQWTPLDTFKGSIQKNAAINVNGKIYSCFGFLNGILYLGSRHHMGIMQAILDHGWTWEQLVNAKQLWGWCGTLPNKDRIHLSYTTDAARLDRDLDEELKEVFGSLTHKPVESSFGGASNEEYAPTWNSLYGPEGIMKNTPDILVYDYRSGSEVIWQGQDIQNREVNPDAPPANSDWEEEDW